jgi:hypothetical protein
VSAAFRRRCLDVVGSFVWLATPFAVFLRYHGYTCLEPEALLGLAVLAVVALGLGTLVSSSHRSGKAVYAALVTFYLDVQFDALTGGVLIASFIFASLLFWQISRHLTEIATVVGATMFASTILMPVYAADAARARSISDADSHLPLVLHIVLDEHIGIEGVPADATGESLGSELRSFYQRNGFQLFGRAYSEFFNTPQSLSHLLNLSSGIYVPDLYARGAGIFSWTLQRNRHFADLARRGHAIRVYQSSYLDVCVEPETVVSCETYNFTGLGALKGTPLSAARKAQVIATIYLARSNGLAALRGGYGRLQRGLAHAGLVLHVWNSGPRHAAPLISMQVMGSIPRALSGARRGDYVFAHLLLPHNPYIYDANCRLNPPSRWLERNAADPASGPINTDDSRALRYRLYAEQLRCTYRHLEAILDAIPAELEKDAVVIIHGDHGSRIARVEPNLSRTTPQASTPDYADSYSTLFAVRAPGIPVTYETRVVAITCLFGALVKSKFSAAPDPQACALPSVFVFADSKEVDTATLPPFGRGADEQIRTSSAVH